MMKAPAEDRLAMLERRYRPALFAYFIRRIANHAEAEDLTQEVLMRLVELPTSHVERPDAYIFTIAGNLLRDRSRRLQVRDTWREHVQVAEPHADFVDPLRLLESREQLGVVTRAIAELPQKSREILLLFRLERMRKRDIAESYGISVSAVDKHLIRAMAYLTSKMEAGE